MLFLSKQYVKYRFWRGFSFIFIILRNTIHLVTGWNTRTKIKTNICRPLLRPYLVLCKLSTVSTWTESCPSPFRSDKRTLRSNPSLTLKRWSAAPCSVLCVQQASLCKQTRKCIHYNIDKLPCHSVNRSLKMDGFFCQDVDYCFASRLTGSPCIACSYPYSLYD